MLKEFVRLLAGCITQQSVDAKVAVFWTSFVSTFNLDSSQASAVLYWVVVLINITVINYVDCV